MPAFRARHMMAMEAHLTNAPRTRAGDPKSCMFQSFKQCYNRTRANQSRKSMFNVRSCMTRDAQNHPSKMIAELTEENYRGGDGNNYPKHRN
eukprot:2752365-Amphidinium_carterae.1